MKIVHLSPNHHSSLIRCRLFIVRPPACGLSRGNNKDLFLEANTYKAHHCRRSISIPANVYFILFYLKTSFIKFPNTHYQYSVQCLLSILQYNKKTLHCLQNSVIAFSLSVLALLIVGNLTIKNKWFILCCYFCNDGILPATSSNQQSVMMQPLTNEVLKFYNAQLLWNLQNHATTKKTWMRRGPS